MRQFQVGWTKDRIESLRAKLRAFRPPAMPAHPGWELGTDADYLRALCAYALDRYDMDTAQATLNRYPQIVAPIDGLDIHAVHVVGEAQGRKPLLLIHGWPGSHYEFWDVVEPLAFPSRHGGNAADAFDLVIPSLPGFGFSGKPATPIGARTTAGLFDKLMRETLGYPRYCAQGGDWGSAVCAWLGLEHAASLHAIHLNYLLVHPAHSPQTAEEKAYQAARDQAQARLGAYAMLQGTKPRTLAYAMADNPVAQAAWIVERFHDWSDQRARRFEDIFPMDRQLTNILVYVMNDAFVSTLFYYSAAMAEGVRQMPPGRRVEVPTAFTTYHDPRMPNAPRSWVERGYNVTRWTEQPHGGHFAAMEVPEAFVADLRAWGREIG